jgi:OmpA-OmpF porin, OOP family
MFPCRHVKKKIISSIVFLLCLRGTQQSAFAQDLMLDVRGFAPPTDPDATFALQPTAAPGPGIWTAGFVASYARRLLVVDDASGHELAVPIADQLSTDFMFNIGIGERLALGWRLPMAVRQGGDSFAPLGWQLPRSALGDVMFEAKATLIPRGSLGGFGLSSVARMTAPTGDANSSISNAGVTGEMHLLGELDWIFAALRLSAGVMVRSERQTLLGDTFGQQLPWAIGLLVRPRALGWDDQGHWQWFVESNGGVSLSPNFAERQTSPALFGLGARYAFAKDFSALMGAQLPLNSAVGVPTLRVVFGINWSPRIADEDGDGIPDDADDCPEIPGPQDNDGCPEEDNDNDGIPDDKDKCPNAPETVNGFQDSDGCPD